MFPLYEYRRERYIRHTDRFCWRLSVPEFHGQNSEYKRNLLASF